MNLFWRFLWIIFFSKFETKVDFFAESKTSFRVFPTDIDIIGHMNNGRYLSYMDLGRINFMIRSDMFAKLNAESIYPVIASETVRFKKSIKLFQKFDLTTKILGWDDKFIYMKHRCMVNGEIYTIALVKAAFLRKNNKGLIDTKELMKAIQLLNIQSPPLPLYVTNWNESDRNFYEDCIK